MLESVDFAALKEKKEHGEKRDGQANVVYLDLVVPLVILALQVLTVKMEPAVHLEKTAFQDPLVRLEAEESLDLKGWREQKEMLDPLDELVILALTVNKDKRENQAKQEIKVHLGQEEEMVTVESLVSRVLEDLQVLWVQQVPLDRWEGKEEEVLLVPTANVVRMELPADQVSVVLLASKARQVHPVDPVLLAEKDLRAGLVSKEHKVAQECPENLVLRARSVALD